MNHIEWGKGGFMPNDWKVLYDLIIERKIKSVLEYGCGLSTELMKAIGLEIISLETQKEYLIPEMDIKLYDYPNFPEINKQFDLCFIDAPGAREFEIRGVKPERKFSAIHATTHSNLIFLHDGGQGQIEPILSAGFKQINNNPDRDLIFEK